MYLADPKRPRFVSRAPEPLPSLSGIVRAHKDREGLNDAFKYMLDRVPVAAPAEHYANKRTVDTVLDEMCAHVYCRTAMSDALLASREADSVDGRGRLPSRLGAAAACRVVDEIVKKSATASPKVGAAGGALAVVAPHLFSAVFEHWCVSPSPPPLPLLTTSKGTTTPPPRPAAPLRSTRCVPGSLPARSCSASCGR